MARKPKAKKEKIATRVSLLYALFLVAGLAIVVMILVTQWGSNGRPLRERARNEMYITEEIPPARGTIYASDGESILVCNSPFYNVYFDFTKVPEKVRHTEFTKYKKAMIDSLVAIFPRYSRAQMTGNVERIFTAVIEGRDGRRRMQFVKDSISQTQLDRLRMLPIVSRYRSILSAKYYQQRYFPLGSLAGSAVRDIGITREFNKYLTGKSGITTKVLLYHDMPLVKVVDEDGNAVLNAKGKPIYDTLYYEYYVPVKDAANRDVENGYDVVTTLDVRIQDIVERELRAVMEGSKGAQGTGAVDGTAIVMSVLTGEIRAVANLTRDANGHFTDNSNNPIIENHAIRMRTEPGSTFKIVPLMALLEDGWDVNQVVFCENGKYTDKHKNYVEDTHPIGNATIREIFEQSSNIGFVKMIESRYDNNPVRFVDFVKGLNIDDSTTFSMWLDGGLTAVVKDPRGGKGLRRWDRGVSLMKMAYGYAVELTPLHTLTLYNAIANGGKMVEPILVKEIRKGNQTIESFEARVVNEKICSERTLGIVQSYLERVIERGTGRGAYTPRYRIAGKTGTAQVALPGGRGYKDQYGGMYYLASFVGYFPADKPEYSVIVAVKTYFCPGTGAKRYGAEFGVPVFKAMADQIFSTFTERVTPLDVISTPDKAVSKRTRAETAINAGTMPDVCGMGLRDAIYLLEKLGMQVKSSGYGTITEQYPSVGEAITEGQQARLKLS